MYVILSKEKSGEWGDIAYKINYYIEDITLIFPLKII